MTLCAMGYFVELCDSCHKNAPNDMAYTFPYHEANESTKSNAAIPGPSEDSKEEVKEIYTCRYFPFPFSRKIPGMHVNIL